MTKTFLSRRGEIRVLVAGGGVAGLETVLALRHLAGEFVEVELLAPEHHFWYRPLAVAEPFGGARVHRWELADLARAAGAQFTPGKLSGLDPDGHVARLSHGPEIGYDAVVIACGARPREALPGALTFRGPADVERFRGLLDALERGEARHVVFALPAGVTWPLPLYELALLAASELERKGVEGVDLTLVTPEPSPLALFGAAASDALRALLEERAVDLLTSTYPTDVGEAWLSQLTGGRIPADHVVALPRLLGPAIEGVPRDRDEFVPTDPLGRVHGLADVYAAGDATTFPIKQGGLAAQQADAVASLIAARAGADVEPRPFLPVLRALLLTGSAPMFLRVELGGGHGEPSTVAGEALWWPPGKIVGRYLAPFLANLGVVDVPEEPLGADVVRLEVDAAAAHLLARPG